MQLEFGSTRPRLPEMSLGGEQLSLRNIVTSPPLATPWLAPMNFRSYGGASGLPKAGQAVQRTKRSSSQRPVQAALLRFSRRIAAARKQPLDITCERSKSVWRPDCACL